MHFDLEQAARGDEVRQAFDADGYVVVHKLIDVARVDLVLQALQRFKRAAHPYYAQTIHTWIRPQIDAHGFMVESMENFTRLFFNAGLADAGNDILLGPEVLRVLRQLDPRHEHFALWQNMLFDRSTGTIDHQDSWYLDTVPRGHLLAAWVALEDIEPGSGPFHVYPGSHRLIDAHAMARLSHAEFAAHCAVVARTMPMEQALLSKGSVLFWHPWTLHGASRQTDATRSRKSLTAHYYPIGTARQHNGRAIASDPVGHARQLAGDLLLTRHIGPRPIPVGYSWMSQCKFNLGGLLRYATNRVSGRVPVAMDMRRRPAE